MMIASLIGGFPVLSNKGNEHISNIYRFVTEKNLNELTSDSDMFSLIEGEYFATYIKENAKLNELKSSLNKFDFFDDGNYENKEAEDLYIYQNVLYKFKNVLLEYLDNKDKQPRESEFFELPGSPRMEAFIKVGNNKIDITPSGKDYGYIFE